MLAHAALALALVIRVYDAYGVAPSTLATARGSAERIMASAGIHVTWVQCPCDETVGGAELVLRVISAPPSRNAGELGFSYVDTVQKSGTLATIFADRVQRLARLANASDAELLGRAMAHEIAHLLFGTRDHAPVGLMRAMWTSSELAGNRPIDWQFSPRDSARLRQSLIRRLRVAPGPTAVMAADADLPAASSVSAQ